MNKKLKGKKYVCNYHFIAECLDLYPEDIKKTKCSGVSKKQAEEGYACDNWHKQNLNH